MKTKKLLSRSKVLFILSVALSITACGGSGGSGEGEESEPTVERRIFGNVVDETTQIPIEGATIRSEPATNTVRTDSNGYYELIEQLTEGQQYRIIASVRGYKDELTNVSLVRATQADFALANNALTVDKSILQLDSTRIEASVQITSPQDTDYSVSSSTNWLVAAPASGSLVAGQPGFIRVSIDPALVPQRLTDAKVSINSAGGVVEAAVINVVSAFNSELGDDFDNDGVSNANDNCPFIPNSAQADIDSDGFGDRCDAQLAVDQDNDGIRDNEDNCPTVSNSSQLNSDGAGAGDACSDGSPVITAYQTSGSQITTGQSVTFSWSYTGDVAGTVCTLDVNGNGVGVVTIEPCSPDGTYTHTYTAAGTYDVALTATNATGQSTSESTVTVSEEPVDPPPVVTSFNIDNEQAPAGASITFTWEHSGGNGTVCSLDLGDENSEVVVISPCNAQSSYTHTYAQTGTYDAILTVEDSAGQTTTSTSTVNVVPIVNDPESTPPVLSSYLVDDVQPMIEEPITFTWEYTGGGNGTVCRLDISGDGSDAVVISPCNNMGSYTHTYTRPGAYEVDLTVENANGETATLTRTVTVSPISFKIMADGPATPGGRVYYTVSISNVSDVPVESVGMLLRVPEGMSFGRSSDASPNASSCSSTCVAGNEATWNLGRFASGASRAIRINARIADTMQDGDELATVFSLTSTSISGSINRRLDTEVKPNKKARLKLGFSTDAVQAGESVVLHADIGNTSEDSLQQSQLSIAVPPGSIVTQVSNGGLETSDGNVVWDLGALAGQQSLRRSVSLTLSNSAIPGQIILSKASLRFDSNSEIDNQASAALSVTQQQSPLTVSISSSVNPVVPGGRLRYTVTVGNQGQVPLTDTTVLMRVPSAVTFSRSEDASPNATNCSSSCVAGSEAIWNLGTIAVGSSRSIEINTNVLSGIKSGSLISAPFSFFANEQPDSIDLLKTSRVTSNRLSTVVLSSESDTVQPSTSNPSVYDNVTLNANYSNLSAFNGSNLNGLSLSVSLPPNASLISATGNGNYNTVDNTVEWPLAPLPLLGTGTQSLELAIDSSTKAGESSVITAMLIHDGGNEVDASNEYRLNVAAGRIPLETTVGTDEPSVAAGSKLRYTLTLRNLAFTPLDNVTVVYRLPGGVSFGRSSDANPNASGCSSTCVAGNEAYWQFASIPAGETRTIDINAQISGSVQAGSLIVSPIRVVASQLANDISLVNVIPISQ